MIAADADFIRGSKWRFDAGRGDFDYLPTFGNRDFLRALMGSHLEIECRSIRLGGACCQLIVRGSFETSGEFFADTDPPKPVPAVLTEYEAIRYLRLDEEERDPTSAQRAFRRLVETRRIRPCRVGRWNRYAREELKRFVLDATDMAGESPHSEGFDGI